MMQSYIFISDVYTGMTFYTCIKPNKINISAAQNLFQIHNTSRKHSRKFNCFIHVLSRLQEEKNTSTEFLNQYLSISDRPGCASLLLSSRWRHLWRSSLTGICGVGCRSRRRTFASSALRVCNGWIVRYHDKLTTMGRPQNSMLRHSKKFVSAGWQRLMLPLYTVCI